MQVQHTFLRRSSVAGRDKVKLNDALDAYRPLLGVWLIEIALMLNWHKKSSRRAEHLFEDSDFVTVSGLKGEYSYERESICRVSETGEKIPVNHAEAQRILLSLCRDLRKKKLKDELNILENIEMMGGLLGLSETEKAIVCFVSVFEMFSNFHDAIGTRRQKISTKDMVRIIANLTGHSECEIQTAFAEDSVLISGGLVHLERKPCDFEDKLELNSSLSSVLLQKHQCADSMMKRFLKTPSPSTLNLTNFPHLECDIATLKAYLANVIQHGADGTNVMLYGAPGTGKTEFLKALALEMGIELYEIPFSDADGDPISGKARLAAYNLCQRMLAGKQNVLLMFDEVEDVFSSEGDIFPMLGSIGEGEKSSSSKAWINRTLERNATPAFWITNDGNIDPAYLRRFDYSIRFSIPPMKVRTEIARHHLGQFLPSNHYLEAIAGNELTFPRKIVFQW